MIGVMEWLGLANREPEPPALTGKVHDYTKQYWGHAISNWSRKEGSDVWSIVGHGPAMAIFTRLRAGDVITSKMESGSIGRFRINAVEYYADPDDMFIALIEFIGYEGAVVG